MTMIDEMPNITIIGGGNMGSLLSAKFSQKYNVTLFLNAPYEKAEEYHNDMVIFNEDKSSFVFGKIKLITENLLEAVKDANWIFITYPSFLFESFSKQLVPLLHEGQHLVGVPGSGGFELYFKEVLKKGVTITGLQRVHSVARIVKKGQEVRESGVRTGIKCASIPKSFNNKAAKFISSCYSLPVEPLNNYLNVTLLNSNPILHTSRLYSIFKDYEKVKGYNSLPLFYEEWSLDSSILLIDMDKELFSVFDALKEYGIEVNQITTLLEHYDSTNYIEMTNKITSIKSLKGLTTPSVKSSNGKYLPDFDSRYFSADFPYGLDILLCYARILNVQCPNMKIVSDWYHRVTNTKRHFDLALFGIENVNDLKTIYSY